MSKLKINADTSPVKKSLMDLGNEVKKMGKTKISIFSAEDKKFLKEGLNKELSLMKDKLNSNKLAIKDMVKESAKLTKGSKDELKLRKEINEAYKVQARLANQSQQLQSTRQGLSSGGGIMSGLGRFAKGGGAALGALGLARAGLSRVTSSYRDGAADRVRLQGLGVSETEMNRPSAERLARAGLDRSGYIKSMTQSMSTLGRGGSSESDVLQRSMFERGKGLEQGSMTNVAGSLRSSFGGAGANEAQMKIQANILASGMDEALGPYLETITGMLSEINENGMTQTDELLSAMTNLSKDGVRTPEQLSKLFGGLNSTMKGSTGENNAFFQQAFSRAGIGGGGIGATQLAISGEGLYGMDEESASKRYSKSQMEHLRSQGAFKGLQDRGGGILEALKAQSGIGSDQSLGDVTGTKFDTLQMQANERFGTSGRQGFEIAQIMEKVKNDPSFSQKDARSQIDALMESDPSMKRLDLINTSISGSTEILKDINKTLKDRLGENLATTDNAATKVENAALGGAGSVTSGVSNYGGAAAMAGAGALSGAGMGFMMGGPIGAAIGGLGGALVGGIGGSFMDNGTQSTNLPTSQTKSERESLTELERAIASGTERGTAKALATQRQVIQNNNKLNVKVITGDGSVNSSTYRK